MLPDQSCRSNASRASRVRLAGGRPNILSKMGANDRTHAAILGIKRGIIA
jgi:hypothetical protein